MLYQNTTHPVSDRLPQVVLPELVALGNVLETHLPNVFVWSSGLVEDVWRVTLDEAGPKTLLVESGVVEEALELGDFVGVVFGGGWGRTGIGTREKTVDLIGPVSAMRIKGPGELVGFLPAAEGEFGAVNPVVGIVGSERASIPR